MTAPPTTATTTPQRAYATHTPKWQRFQSTLILSSTTTSTQAAVSSSSGKKGSEKQQQYPYQRQYSHVYHQRLAALGPRCWERMDDNDNEKNEQKDKKNLVVTKVQRILELRENVPSLLVGTLVKETTTTSGDGDPVLLLHPDSQCKASDALYLEDESGRVALGFSSSLSSSSSSNSTCSSLHEFPTGVVLGLQGTVGVDGVLQVQAVFPPKLPAPVVASPPPEPSNGNRKKTATPHLLLLSGLRCGAADVSSLPRDMLLSFLQGHLGTTEKAACVSRVVIAGGLIQSSFSSNHGSKQLQQQPSSSSKKNNETVTTTTTALRDLDAFLLQLTASGIPVTVLPGQDDPTTANWPQRPLHTALLPRSSSSSASSSSVGTSLLLTRAPNPYAAALHGKLVVGTDGTNIRDLTKRMLVKSKSNKNITTTTKDDVEHGSDEDDSASLVPVSELQALRRTLEWSHICPTGPDTVPTVPHLERDPMVLTEWPALYFAGNARQFATAKVPPQQGNNSDVVANAGTNNSCRLVCIPEFASTGQAVLVNMETLNVEILRFED